MDGHTLVSDFFLFRLLINTAFMVLVVRVIYFKTYHKSDLFFTFFLLNFIVFLLSYMLEQAKAFNSLSSAFGLLAAFSLLRFRTETLTTKDMTYLFIMMAVGLINSVMKGTYLEISGINLGIAAVVYAVDGNQLMRNQKIKIVEYDKIENIKPEHHALLLQDLRTRTGLDIKKTSIEEIDLVKNRAVIKIYYY
ncbi:MAG: DUF4956 domain-containing protein [Cyclobacteriaceae bacterium]|jgi:hypothetical protein|nr:DUF4956 domain-containing protein [Cyclobacteriaceae bacterium]